MAEREPGTPGKDPATTTDQDRRAGIERRYEAIPVEPERRVTERRYRDRLLRVLGRIGNFIDYLFFLLYGLLSLRFLLALLGANDEAGFVRFMHGITEPFYAPFSDIVSSPSVNGGTLDFPTLIALAVYVLLHMAVRGLLRVLTGNRI